MHQGGVTIMVPTLNNMADLKNSGFGRPKPRHGLKLLYWFANDYIDFDLNNQMTVKYDPRNGGFGFHYFQNRRDNCDNNGCRSLLPEEGFHYYEVGNLHKENSSSLPKYIRAGYTGHLDDSNTDRIIISLRQNMRVEVYVTQHEDMRRFDPAHTYRISKGLLKMIPSRPLGDFLNKAGYATVKVASPASTSPAYPSPAYTSPAYTSPAYPSPADTSPGRTETCYIMMNVPDTPVTPVTPVSQERKGICDRFCTIL